MIFFHTPALLDIKASMIQSRIGEWSAISSCNWTPCTFQGSGCIAEYGLSTYSCANGSDVSVLFSFKEFTKWFKRLLS